MLGMNTEAATFVLDCIGRRVNDAKTQEENFAVQSEVHAFAGQGIGATLGFIVDFIPESQERNVALGHLWEATLSLAKSFAVTAGKLEGAPMDPKLQEFVQKLVLDFENLDDQLTSQLRDSFGGGE